MKIGAFRHMIRSKTARLSTNILDGVLSDLEVLKIQMTMPFPIVEAKKRNM